MLPSGLHPLGRDGPDLFLQIDLRPQGLADLARPGCGQADEPCGQSSHTMLGAEAYIASGDRPL